MTKPDLAVVVRKSRRGGFRPGAGRKRAPDRIKTEVVSLRLPSKEVKKLRKAATRRNISLAKLLKGMIQMQVSLTEYTWDGKSPVIVDLDEVFYPQIKQPN